MKKIILVLGVLVFLLVPMVSSAAAAKTFFGIVVGINGSQIVFAATSAAKYSAEVGSATLQRKNGMAMKFSEILIGDKVEVLGQLWADNSISATQLRNLSLYSHKGTFTGKIVTINPLDSSFVTQSKANGSQIIHTNNFTSFTKNGAGATFMDLLPGMTVSVKGVWDRSNADVIGTIVSGTYRLIDIYFTGSLSMKSSSSLTVIGNGNVIYGIDISKAELQNKSSKDTSVNSFVLGDTLRVWGKHLSGSVQIVGTKIKDSSR